MSSVVLEDLFDDDALGEEDDDAAESDGGGRRTDNNKNTYAWESGYNATWIQKAAGGDNQTSCLLYAIKDKEGKIDDIKRLFVDAEKRVRRPYMDTFRYQPTQFFQQRSSTGNCIRSLVLILDFSESMKDPDLKPSRIACLQTILTEFIAEYFKAGPISQMALFVMTNKEAHLLNSLTGNPTLLQASIDELNKGDVEAEGDPSVQAALERASRLLATAPPYATKEILMIFGSCLTNDAGNLETTVNFVKAENLKVSVVSLAPELQILKRLCNETGGDYIVAVNRNLLREAILSHTQCLNPNTVRVDKPGHRLIPMGFPSLTSMSTVSLCVCHNRLGFDGYNCPRCQMRSCSLPTLCRACDLALVSAVDVARCQANDTTPPPFIPLPGGDGHCFLCNRMFSSGGGQCPRCHGFVCFDCDVLLHSILNFCPNCHKNDVLMRQGLSAPNKPPLILPPTAWPDTQFLQKVAKSEHTSSAVAFLPGTSLEIRPPQK